MRRLILIICISIYAATSGQAQHIVPIFKHIGYNEGLSNSTIEAILQDSRGFIWIGTRDGLNKYDGSQMVTYRNNPLDTNSLTDNYIKFLYEDSSNILWIGTLNGLCQFDPFHNKFINIKKSNTKAKTFHDNITGILEDHQKNIWISSDGGGIQMYNRASRQFHDVKLALATGVKGSAQVHCLFKDQQEKIWAGSNDGLNLYDPSKKCFIQVKGLAKGIVSIQQSEDEKLWLGTERQGIQVYHPITKTIKAYLHSDLKSNSLGSNMVLRVLIDRQQRIWIGTINGGLNLYDSDRDAFNVYKMELSDKFSWSQRTVSALFEDKQGNLWIGTHRGGINLYQPNAKKFDLYQQQSGNGLVFNDIKSFCEDKEGNIWIGTDGGGLSLFNPQNRRFKTYTANPLNRSSLSSDAVLDVIEDKKHRIWVATWGGGINLFDKKTGLFKRFTTKSQKNGALSSDYVQKIYQHSNGTLYVGTYYKGLNVFNENTNQFSRIQYDPSGRTSLSGNNIVAICEDKDHNLWLGTNDGGLNCYHFGKKRFEHYFNRMGKAVDIRAIFSDSRGRLWVGSNGLYLFDRKENKFKSIPSKAGLNHVSIKNITEDRSGYLWISSSNGLFKFDPQRLISRKYDANDGLQGSEFEDNACLRTRDGKLYFGGTNGFNSFYPEAIKNNPFIPPVYFTGFQIFNKEVAVRDKNSPLISDISFTKEMELKHDQSSIAFTFVALNYIAPNNNQYAYKLDGFESNWTYTRERKAIYTNLSPGNYVFHVKASNNDGLWNHQGKSIQITILPPFWKTWWFLLLLIVLSGTLIFKLVQFRQGLLLQNEEVKRRQELHNFQLDFFTNISHEFKTPLSLILGPLENIIHNKSYIFSEKIGRIMYRNALRLLNLVNELIDFRRLEAGMVTLKVIEIDPRVFLNEIAYEFENVAKQKGIDFHITCSDASFNKVWVDKAVLEKILLNLLNNSIKHTQSGSIEIRLFSDTTPYEALFKDNFCVLSEDRANRYFYITIVDTGSGISKATLNYVFDRYYRSNVSQEGSGIGLAFVKSLVLHHRGHVYISSALDQGTEVTVAIPLGKENYTALETAPEKSATQHELMPEQFLVSEFQGLVHDTEVISHTLLKRILLVDDNEELLLFLKDSLSVSYSVVTATNGSEALEWLSNQKIDMIISDVMMPVMDGISLCRTVKENSELKHIPFILLTAKSEVESNIEGLQSGADLYFPKPFSPAVLQLAINNLFKQHNILEDYFNRHYHHKLKEQAHSKIDQEFIAKLSQVLENNLQNLSLGVEFLSSELNMSHTRLYENVKRITGHSVIEFIRKYKLAIAREMLAATDLAITEIIEQVGIQTQSYFTHAFKKEFGKTPSQFRQEIKSSTNTRQ